MLLHRDPTVVILEEHEDTAVGAGNWDICAQTISVASEIEHLVSFNNLSSSASKKTCLIFSRMVVRQIRRESAQTRPDHQTNTQFIPQFGWRRSHVTGYKPNTQQSDGLQKFQNAEIGHFAYHNVYSPVLSFPPPAK